MISIIVTVYNLEKYIKKCLDSIINNYSNIEIIVIDDASTDKSLDIIKSYQDPRIKVIINEKNYGIARCRNIGIDNSKGEYIWFIDGDDFIESNSLDIISNYLFKYDIIVFNYKRNKKCNTFYNYDDISTKYLLSHCVVWNKVIKKSLFKNNYFHENMVYEDLYLIPTLILKTNKIIFIDAYLYNYIYRFNSLKNTSNNIKDRILSVNNLYDKLNNKYKDEMEYLYIYNLLITSLIEEVINNYKYDFKYINKIVKNKYKKYYKNKYLNKHTKLYLYLVYLNLIPIVRIITYLKFKGRKYD